MQGVPVCLKVEYVCGVLQLLYLGVVEYSENYSVTLRSRYLAAVKATVIWICV